MWMAPLSSVFWTRERRRGGWGWSTATKLRNASATEEGRGAGSWRAKPTFALGFLTGTEMDWLPEAMRILHDELPNIEVTVSSQYSPDLADALMRGRLDPAFIRSEKHADNLVYRRVTTEPLVVVFPS